MGSGYNQLAVRLSVQLFSSRPGRLRDIPYVVLSALQVASREKSGHLLLDEFPQAPQPWDNTWAASAPSS